MREGCAKIKNKNCEGKVYRGGSITVYFQLLINFTVDTVHDRYLEPDQLKLLLRLFLHRRQHKHAVVYLLGPPCHRPPLLFRRDKIVSPRWP